LLFTPQAEDRLLIRIARDTCGYFDGWFHELLLNRTGRGSRPRLRQTLIRLGDWRKFITPQRSQKAG
jgi:hypothetical protein